MSKTRLHIPKVTRDGVLAEFSHRCAIWGADKPQVHPIDENPSNCVFERANEERGKDCGELPRAGRAVSRAGPARRGARFSPGHSLKALSLAGEVIAQKQRRMIEHCTGAIKPIRPDVARSTLAFTNDTYATGAIWGWTHIRAVNLQGRTY